MPMVCSTVPVSVPSLQMCNRSHAGCRETNSELWIRNQPEKFRTCARETAQYVNTGLERPQYENAEAPLFDKCTCESQQFQGIKSSLLSSHGFFSELQVQNEPFSTKSEVKKSLSGVHQFSHGQEQRKRCVWGGKLKRLG